MINLFLVVMEDSAAMLVGLLAALAGISLTQLTGSPDLHLQVTKQPPQLIG